jgi:hypothetical protein
MVEIIGQLSVAGIEPNPYRAQWDVNSVFHYGHNPSLVARYVTDLIVSVDSVSGFEVVKWVEPPRYELIPGTCEITIAKGPIEREARRTVVGPLSQREPNRYVVPVSLEALRDSEFPARISKQKRACRDSNPEC